MIARAIRGQTRSFGYPNSAISIVTWIELNVGTTAANAPLASAFLSDFAIIPLDSDIAARTVLLRRQHGIRLPDAIIWASAQIHDMLLITRNTKDFSGDDPSVRGPYQL
jgi:predicted nucleic acid-binding protein